MNLLSNSRILATGRYVPDTVVTNEQIELQCGLKPGWIEKRTGIQTRPVVSESQSVSDLAIAAGQSALEEYANQVSDRDRHPVGLLILATSTPDYLLPPTAPYVADKLSLGMIPAFDMAVACSGFVYALQVADGFCRTQQRPVLVVAANVLSKRVSSNDPSTAAVFSDGAGAVILEPANEPGIFSIELESDGRGFDCLRIPHGGSKIPFNEQTLSGENHKMKIKSGLSVFRYAVDCMSRLGAKVLENAGKEISEVDFWIPHQANLRIIESVRENLGIPLEKTGITVDRFANSSAATIPTALDYFFRAGAIQRGDLVLLTTAAAGLTGGAALVRL
jgi:3-oxoacyl-[acyl-carrier-protein] synthase-3